MTVSNIVGGAIVFVVVAAIIALTIYKSKKSNPSKTITFDDFIEMYGDQIIAALKDVVEILQVNMDEFDDREEYERVIISLTITKLKENSSELGIDATLVNLFDTDTLTEIVCKVFNGHAVEIFSVLGKAVIASNVSMYSDDVVLALCEDGEELEK